MQRPESLVHVPFGESSLNSFSCLKSAYCILPHDWTSGFKDKCQLSALLWIWTVSLSQVFEMDCGPVRIHICLQFLSWMELVTHFMSWVKFPHGKLSCTVFVVYEVGFLCLMCSFVSNILDLQHDVPNGLVNSLFGLHFAHTCFHAVSSFRCGVFYCAVCGYP